MIVTIETKDVTLHQYERMLGMATESARVGGFLIFNFMWEKDVERFKELRVKHQVLFE